MNLKDWEKLSAKEQSELVEPAPEVTSVIEGRKAECPDALIELRNSLKREIDEEQLASSKYREASVKMLQYGHGASAFHLKEIAEQELMHHYMLRQIVDLITEDCGE